MHSNSLYGLKLSVLRSVGAKALATDHRERMSAWEANERWTLSERDLTVPCLWWGSVIKFE